MERRGLTPGQWRSLPQSERNEMMAFVTRIDDNREQLLRQIRELPGEMGLLAQVLALLKTDD
mgnify:FL=1